MKIELIKIYIWISYVVSSVTFGGVHVLGGIELVVEIISIILKEWKNIYLNLYLKIKFAIHVYMLRFDLRTVSTFFNVIKNVFSRKNKTYRVVHWITLIVEEIFFQKYISYRMLYSLLSHFIDKFYLKVKYFFQFSPKLICKWKEDKAVNHYLII